MTNLPKPTKDLGTQIGGLAKGSTVALVFGGLIVSANSSFAQNQNTGIGPYPYARVAIEHHRFDDSVGSANIKNIALRGGYMFMPILGAEARLGTTVDGQEYTGTTLAGEVTTDYTAAALLRVQANFDPGIAPYLAIGVGTSKISSEFTAPTATNTSATESGGVGYIGLDFQMKNGLTLGGEIGRTFDDSMTFSTHFGLDF